MGRVAHATAIGISLTVASPKALPPKRPAGRSRVRSRPRRFRPPHAHESHMADDWSLTDRARELIEQLEAMRWESETIRGRIEEAMRQDRSFWPDRRRTPRGLAAPDKPPEDSSGS